MYVFYAGYIDKQWNLLMNLKRKVWQKTAKNSQKDSEKLFSDTRPTKNKPLFSFRALLRTRSHSKTVFKNLATANTPNEISQFYYHLKKQLGKRTVVTHWVTAVFLFSFYAKLIYPKIKLQLPTEFSTTFRFL